jgi:uncharacterized protein YqhQ
MKIAYGGQAVLEGVMMRSPSSWAVAVVSGGNVATETAVAILAGE